MVYFAVVVELLCTWGTMNKKLYDDGNFNKTKSAHEYLKSKS